MESPVAATPQGASAVQSLMAFAGTVKEKWDASGANEAIARVSSSIPEGTKDYFNATSQQLFNRQHIRPLAVCFGFGEERPFYVEKTPSLLMERLRHNATFFYMNYLIMFAVMFVLTLVIPPSAIIGIALLGFAWVYVIKASQNGQMKIGSFTIQQKQASIGMGIISIMVLLYLLSNVFWWTLFSGGFLLGIHASLRDASLHKDEGDKMEMQGDLNLGSIGADPGEPCRMRNVIGMMFSSSSCREGLKCMKLEGGDNGIGECKL